MENKKDFIINVLYYALIIGIAYLFCNYLLGIFAPFLLGFLFAFIAVRIAKFVFKKETNLVRIISLILLYLVVIGVIALLTALGINELIEFFEQIPTLYKQYVEPVLQGIGVDINTADKNLPLEMQSEIRDTVSSLLSSIKTLVSNISSYIVGGVSGLISNTTSALIAVLTIIITSFFVAADYENIISYIESMMPKKIKSLYDEITDFLVNTVLLVAKSYGIIMFITFVELFIGLMLIGVNNFALISMITAFLDILPILGVGTILIPWFIFELIVGKTTMGIMLAVLYIIITIVRNIIEPKIVGGNLGLHPLAALFSMLVGVQLFGVIGMFGLPILISFLVKRSENRVK